MRKIKVILRLKYGIGWGLRDVAHSDHVSPGTVHGLIGRVEAAKLTWQLPAYLSDEQFEAMLYPGDPGQESL